jgi:hypothetical protein
MIILYISILLLTVIILFLSLAIYFLIKKSTYLTEKEKEFIIFVINIFRDYGDDLGIKQTKEQHQKLVEELEKIKKKHLITDKNDKA